MNTTLTQTEKRNQIESKICSKYGSKIITLFGDLEYAFLGFTKKQDKVILGEIEICGINGIKIHKKTYRDIDMAFMGLF